MGAVQNRIDSAGESVANALGTSENLRSDFDKIIKNTIDKEKKVVGEYVGVAKASLQARKQCEQGAYRSRSHGRGNARSRRSAAAGSQKRCGRRRSCYLAVKGLCHSRTKFFPDAGMTRCEHVDCMSSVLGHKIGQS